MQIGWSCRLAPQSRKNYCHSYYDLSLLGSLKSIFIWLFNTKYSLTFIIFIHDDFIPWMRSVLVYHQSPRLFFNDTTHYYTFSINANWNNVRAVWSTYTVIEGEGLCEVVKASLESWISRVRVRLLHSISKKDSYPFTRRDSILDHWLSYGLSLLGSFTFIWFVTTRII